MIDLHCHMLPGIDDGAPDLDTALEMARVAVGDGITQVACTPHIYPGVYENDAQGIRKAVSRFRERLAEAGIPLRLTFGADTHLVPDLVEGLDSGRIPTLNGTRYFLFEPPHHVAPPRFSESVFNVLAAGYVPLITHPERLRWIEDHYELFIRAAGAGAWLQLTAGSLTGRFGRRVRRWSERMLDEGVVHILATDAHNLNNRAPLLAEGRDAAAERVGEEEALRMVEGRPRAVLDNEPPDGLPLPEGLMDNEAVEQSRGRGWLRRLLG
ncbi:MAG: CpsB/CapC family capsule biosynthesis tyrosine phosphatase [Pseudomonadota bacterium]|nr:CpsB/CapC family capsule biosynthesis tyrosine phosphatase [Pseudomonadota bacterium]